ncbi:hypothetical protein [Nocardioides sp.]|jgi:hypothetical protein|uniref:hypothetical protein n=1 Tax=Nocardioides sp. TaxID=35761 RepID=UPI002B6A51E9|nr:hypothetical protein [Nocardioides sp.]HVX55475.1 hypothetical protein [Nocardioides sp.]
MTHAPQPAPELLPDLLDLDALMRGVAPVTSPDDLAAPDVFPDDEELQEFVAWVRAQRNRDIA